jgi:hypothetical protein
MIASKLSGFPITGIFFPQINLPTIDKMANICHNIPESYHPAGNTLLRIPALCIGSGATNPRYVKAQNPLWHGFFSAIIAKTGSAAQASTGAV